MIQFHKYHGAGNDFILIDNRDGSFGVPVAEKIKLWCDRHFGIGADGVILLESSGKADCFMNYYNADGSLAEMCGNGVRCAAKFFLELEKSGKKELWIDTRAGVKKIIVNGDGTFLVNMGRPVFSSPDFPDKSLVLENISLEFASMGNPHAVGFVEDLSRINISEIGPKIEQDLRFRSGINVELVEKISDNHFKVKVWERGSGATLACGTGACAVCAVLNKNLAGGDLKETTLEFPGGNLYLSSNNEGEIILRGGADFVFKGEIKT